MVVFVNIECGDDIEDGGNYYDDDKRRAGYLISKNAVHKFK